MFRVFFEDEEILFVAKTIVRFAADTNLELSLPEVYIGKNPLVNRSRVVAVLRLESLMQRSRL